MDINLSKIYCIRFYLPPNPSELYLTTGAALTTVVPYPRPLTEPPAPALNPLPNPLPKPKNPGDRATLLGCSDPLS